MWGKELRLRLQEVEFGTKQVTFQGSLNINYHSCSPRGEDSRSQSYHGLIPVVDSKVIVHILRVLLWGKTRGRGKLTKNGLRFHINRKKIRERIFPLKEEQLPTTGRKEVPTELCWQLPQRIITWPLALVTAGKYYGDYDHRKAMQLFPLSGQPPTHPPPQQQALLHLPFWKGGRRSNRAGAQMSVRVAASEAHTSKPRGSWAGKQGCAGWLNQGSNALPRTPNVSIFW